MLWLRTIKKAERRRIDVFELWCWRRLLRVPRTARRSNQSILKEISPGCSLEGLMLKLKLQYSSPDAKSWLIGKDSDAGKDWGQEEKETTEDEMVGWHHQLSGHGFGWTPEVGDGQGGLECRGSWGHNKSDTTEQLNWTELKIYLEWVHLKIFDILLFKKRMPGTHSEPPSRTSPFPNKSGSPVFVYL